MSRAQSITLPAGTETVQLKDVPGLLARALHPDLPQSKQILRAVEKAFLGPTGEHDGRTPPCNDADMALVREILGPPPIGKATTDAEWQAYIAPWAKSPRRPDWHPVRNVVDESFDATIRQMAAVEEHKQALLEAIRSGEIVPLSHARVPLDPSVREAMGLGQILTAAFVTYAAKFAVVVRVAPPGVTVEELAARIANMATDAHPDKWLNPNDSDPLRKSIVAAISKHGWPPDGIPGALPFILAEIEVGNVNAFSVFNDIPCNDVSLVRANPAQWYVTPDAERHLLSTMLGSIEGTDRLSAAPSDAATLEPHSLRSILYNNSDEPIWDEWAEFPKLTARQAVPLMHGLNPKFFVAGGVALPPGRARSHPRAQEAFRVCSHRIAVAEASDVDEATPAEWQSFAMARAWPISTPFREISQRATSGNADATAESEASSPQPLQREEFNRREILRVIDELGFDRRAIPRYGPAKSGGKSEVRKRLSGMPAGAFEKAWSNLLKDVIRYGK